MPRFLDVPSWYNSTGKIKSMDDYSEVYKFTTTTPGSSQWFEPTMFGITGNEITALYNGQYLPLKDIATQIRFTFKPTVDFSDLIMFFPFTFYNNSQMSYWKFGSGNNLIVDNGDMFGGSFGDNAILYHYSGSGSIGTFFSQNTTLTTESGWNSMFIINSVNLNSPEQISAVFNIIFNNIELYIIEEPVEQETIVDCEYLYNEIQALK